MANLCSSAQSTRTSGVDTVAGRSASRRESGPPSSATYCSRRAAANKASSNPYQSPPKNMWPLISPASGAPSSFIRSEEHTSELQSRGHLVCRLLLEKKKKKADEDKSRE